MWKVSAGHSRGVGAHDPGLGAAEHAPALGVRRHLGHVLVQLRVPGLAEPQHLAQSGKPDPGRAGVREPQPQHAWRAAESGHARGGRRSPASRRISSLVTEPSAITWQPDRSAKARGEEMRAPHAPRTPAVDEDVVAVEGPPLLVDPGHVETRWCVADLGAPVLPPLWNSHVAPCSALGSQVRQGHVEVVLHQWRDGGEVIEREHLVVVGVARRQLRHGLEQLERCAGPRAGEARPLAG